MQKIKYKTSISLLIVLASILLVLLCLLIVHTFRTGEEATVGIFSLAATLVGTIFIAIELKNGSEVTCSEMLINLNNYFHDSDRLMKVYEVLENAEIDGDYSYSGGRMSPALRLRSTAHSSRTCTCSTGTTLPASMILTTFSATVSSCS